MGTAEPHSSDESGDSDEENRLPELVSIPNQPVTVLVRNGLTPEAEYICKLRAVVTVLTSRQSLGNLSQEELALLQRMIAYGQRLLFEAEQLYVASVKKRQPDNTDDRGGTGGASLTTAC